MVKTIISNTPIGNGSYNDSTNLSQVNVTSRIIDVFDNPKRLVAWSLRPGDKVKVYMVRVTSAGPDGWTRSDDCCAGPREPGEVVIADQMPYVRCGQHVIMTDQSPTAFIDDAGSYILVFEPESGESVIIDVYDDVIKRKTC